jgi:transaldolase
MLVEGRKLARIHKNVVVKVPLTRDGIRACSIFSREGIRVNVTLCFSAGQALLAAKAGAYFVSPFVGRLDDIGANGMDLIREIVTIYRNYSFQHSVAGRVAAQYDPRDRGGESRRAGRHAAVQGDGLALQSPLTDKGLDQFLKDHAKVFQETVK